MGNGNDVLRGNATGWTTLDGGNGNDIFHAALVGFGNSLILLPMQRLLMLSAPALHASS
jgi:hypothetical protein